MQFQNKPFRCFTTRFNGRTNVLTTEILLSEAYDPTSGDPSPEPKQFVGIWDTGATGSVIPKRVADALGLQPTGRVICRGVGKDGTPNEFETNTYLINIHLPNKVAIIGVKVSEGTIAGADLLIGMDVIAQGDFAISNFNGKTTLSFRVPSGEETDYVRDINEYRYKYRDKLRAIEKAVRPVSGPPVRSPAKDDVEKVSRNSPCPCGSGKKYKRCHGKSILMPNGFPPETRRLLVLEEWRVSRRGVPLYKLRERAIRTFVGSILEIDSGDSLHNRLTTSAISNCSPKSFRNLPN